MAVSRGVRLLFDAEQQAVQKGIDTWTLDYMRKYNTKPGQAAIYGTYQAYLKSTPATLGRHLSIAQKEGFTLGVKLVRGAYLGSDPRHLINDTKEATDKAYNSIAKGLLTRQWEQPLSGPGPFPSVSLVLASHNAESVKHARDICESGRSRAEIAFAQLQGMADEVSCDLVYAAKNVGALPGGQASRLPAYKYLVWGSTGECMKYLLRRAYENRDAVQRTRSGRDAMWAEVMRRAKMMFGAAT
jgi:proline dehydrogenase